MPALNFKHLRYFWAVAKAGSIARAAEQLHLTPQSISGQLGELETSLGVELFQRAGRGLVLSDAGQRILGYAEKIFALGDELLDVVHNESAGPRRPFCVGIADSVAKSVVQRVIAPALQLQEPLRLICREGRLTFLLAELAVHHLDMVIADRPMPPNLNVRGYSHLLGTSDLSVFAAPGLAAKLPGEFPALLEDAPFLLPGEDVAIRPRLEQWFMTHNVRPRIIGEFDDSALITAFGAAGAGLFVAPTAISEALFQQYGVLSLASIAALKEELYAITTERHLTHPAIVAIRDAARDEVFGTNSGEIAKSGPASFV